MAPTRCHFLFLLLGQDRFHHIPRLGDVRQVNLRLNRLLRPGGLALAVGRCLARSMTKMSAHPVRFIAFERTGMRLRFGHADFGKDIENRPRLHFQFACEIVDSYLAHPPLFDVATKCPKCS
jgi:hypothetical protein